MRKARLIRSAASVGSGSSAGDIDIVSIAEAGTKLAEIALHEAEKLKDQARNDDNESNIRKQFLGNAISFLRTATFDQYNIVICTDYEHDEFQDLQGQILLLKPIDVEVKKDVLVNFKVYIFDTGIYVRYGKRGREDWSWWGESKERIDPVAMQLYFENAQPKKSAEDINTLMNKGGAQNATAATDADASTKQAAEDTTAANGDSLKTKEEQNVKEGHQTEDEFKKEKQEDEVNEVSDDEEEPCDDVDEESDDVEEKGSEDEDEDAQSEDFKEK